MRCTRSLVVAVAVVAMMPGCFHVDVQAPPRDAPVAARVAAYEQLRPTGQLHTITTNQYGTRTNHELELVTANGMTIAHADDLLPVLDAASPAARTARESGNARRRKWWWMVGGMAVSMVGFAVMSSGFSANIDDPDDEAGVGRQRLGIGLALGGAIAGAGGWYYYRGVEIHRRAATFANYDEGLRGRLGLCIEGIRLVDCPRAAR